MLEGRIRRFRCAECPDYLLCTETAPQPVKGLTLRFGCRYCMGGKRPREMKKRDPKVYPPSWCPKRKEPAELRLYAYKDTNTWYYRELMKRQGLEITPSGPEYALKHEGHINMTAAEFQREAKGRLLSDILGFLPMTGEVIEINDGLKAWFFLVKKRGVTLLFRFDRDAALRNQYEDSLKTISKDA